MLSHEEHLSILRRARYQFHPRIIDLFAAQLRLLKATPDGVQERAGMAAIRSTIASMTPAERRLARQIAEAMVRRLSDQPPPPAH